MDLGRLPGRCTRDHVKTGGVVFAVKVVRAQVGFVAKEGVLCTSSIITPFNVVICLIMSMF